MIIKESSNDYLKELYKPMYDFLSTIDFEPAYNMIKEALGLDIEFTQGRIKEVSGYRDMYLNLDCYSNDFTNQLPVSMSYLFNEIRVSIGFSIASKEIGEIWGSVDYRYHHPEGGSNGCSLFSVKYTEKDGWTLLDRYKDKRIKF